MHIVGIDLSGPANPQGTAVLHFRCRGSELSYVGHITGADDARVFQFVGSLAAAQPVTVGIDAPLSYRSGGGDRPADSQLRTLAIQAGLPPGTVMPPTAPRMVDLTLRGLGCDTTIVRDSL